MTAALEVETRADAQNKMATNIVLQAIIITREE